MSTRDATIASMDTRHPRETLAANINRLIDRDTPPGERRSVRAWATKKGLDVRLIDRLAEGQNSVTLDKLDEVARACGLDAWQLLLEDFDPSSPPSTPISEDERAMITKLRRILDAT